MDTQKALEHFGLDKKQATIYLAALQLGKSGASQIARRSGLKRSTSYVKLHELNIKGLIDITQTINTTLYRAVSPKRLLGLAEFRKTQIEDILPSLMTLYKDDPEKPKIQTFEGFDAVEQVYEEFFSEIKKGEEIFVFGTLLHIETPAFKPAMERWVGVIKKKNIKTKEIVDKSELNVEYLKRAFRDKNPNQKIRVTSGGEFASDNFIHNNKMVMFAVKKHLYATIIEDEDIVGSYRKLFELAWQTAKPPQQ